MFRSRHEKKQRVAANDDHQRHLLAAAKIFFPMHVTMLARHHQQADTSLVLYHGSVATDVDPPLVRIHGHRVATGADVAPTVVDMPDGCRKFADVHRIAGQDIFKNRPVIHDDRRNVLLFFLIMVEVSLTEFLLSEPLREAEGHRAPLARKNID